MEGCDQYELLNYATNLQDFSMTDYGLHRLPDNSFLAAGNRRMTDNGFSAAGYHRHLSSGNDFFSDNHVQPSEISSYHQSRNSSYDSIFDNPLESEFNRLSISGTPSYSYPSAAYVAPQPAAQISNLQRLRAQSAARAQNMGLNLFMDPQMGSGSYYENNLNQQSPLNANLNGLSSYGYNNNYGRSTNLNGSGGYQPSRGYPLGYRSSCDYDIGTWSPYPSRRPVLTNHGIGSSSSSSVSSLISSRHASIFSSLNDLKGKIVLAAKDQLGCRFLQNKFEERKPEDIHLIFSEVKDHICELMIDQFGNYLIQKFFKVCNEEQMTQLLCLLIKDETKFKDICTDMHGTRAVQKLLEHLTTHEQRSRVISVLRRLTLSLIKNNNGQHVIQHCLKYFPSEDNKHILNVVADNCLDVATDKSGCCVLQQCLMHSVGEPRDRLIAQITSNALILAEHPYGNYVVQYILGFKRVQVTLDIMAQLSGNYVSLSMNKYGSNVVEQCLKQSEGDEIIPIIEELICSPNFLRVLQDPYGNYVAQSALMVSKGAAQHAMMELVLVNYPFLHSHPHGKRVLARTKGIKIRP